MPISQSIRFILFVFLAGLFWLSPLLSLHAESVDEKYDPLKGNQEIKKLVRSFSDEKVGPDQFESIRKAITNHIRHGEKGQEGVQKEIQQIDIALKALGDKVTGESAKVSGERSSLEGKRKLKEVELAEFRLLALYATDALAKLEHFRQEGRRQKMFSQGAPFWEVLQEIQTSANQEDLLDLSQVAKHLGKLTGHQIAVIIFGIVTAVWLFVRFLVKIEQLLISEKDSSLGILLIRLRGQSLLSRVVLGILIGSTAASWITLFRVDSPSFLPWLFLSLLLAFLLPMLVEALYLARDKETSGKVLLVGQRVWLRLASLAAGFLFFLFASPDLEIMPENVFLLWRLLAICSFCLLVALAIYSLAGHTLLKTRRNLLRSVLFLVAAVILYLEILGFRALSEYVLAGLAGTLLLYAAAILIQDLVKCLYAVLFRERRHLLGKIGIDLDQENETELLKSVSWLQAILKAVLVTFIGLALIWIWDVSNIYASALFSFLLNGMHIGGLLVVPVRIIMGILIFVFGMSVALWLKNALERKWQPDPSFTASNREALLTVTGYVCYVLAALVGLSVAGVNFTGLTVVAGALSVGIGFGLQNIVNNFVSGLILLFERPIKRGDWVVVGTTEGHVKKISVRSTIIQTFDRSDVIVPNSELIASPVTNMMFNDARGRLRVSVGVAYGSDTELVKRLLLEIAQNQPQVIVDGSSPRPEVFFQAFGESSLDFDLLCHLSNVDNKFRIRSEINFKIDAAFRQHGVEIPFPQRDIRIRQNFQ